MTVSPPSADTATPRMPSWLVAALLAVCALPLALAPILGGRVGGGFPAPFLHGLLEATAVYLAGSIVLLSFLGGSGERGGLAHLIGVVFLASGIVDAFHALAAEWIIADPLQDRDILTFTWVISRLVNAALLLLIPALLVFGSRRSARPIPRIAGGAALFLGSLAVVGIGICLTGRSLPQALFPEAWITRPYDLLPVVLQAATVLVVYPRLTRRCPGVLAQAALLGAVPGIATQLYMAIGSKVPFDAFFYAAHFTRLISYGVPLMALAIARASVNETTRRRFGDLSSANRELEAELEERTRFEEERQNAHKIEAVGRLAGGIAHEFNNLLTTIGVYAELVMGGLSERSPLRNEVERIQAASRQAQLLALGRRSSVQVDPVDLNALVSERVPMLQHLLGSETKLELRLSGDPQPVWGNIDQLQQVVINLASNARDAMAAGGVFAIETSRCAAAELSQRVIADMPSSEVYVLLAVSDSGRGMTAEARDRAFDPFFTTKAQAQGAGLGLSIVHGIVSQAGGHVRIDSEPGCGTRIELYWPLAGAETRTPPTREETSAAPRRREILLVDDDDELRQALCGALTCGGYTVTQAKSGPEAIELARRRERGFDLVVADVVMPHMSGIELAEKLADMHRDSRILLISGYLNTEALARLRSDMHFLAKPFAAKDLVTTASDLLGEPAASSTV